MTIEKNLKVGDIAPDFVLPANTGETISLQNYLGKKAKEEQNKRS